MRTLLVILFILLLVQTLMAGTPISKRELNFEMTGAKSQYRGLRAFKPVLSGVLYRGGGAGGTKPLNSSQLEALCQAGFSSAAYLYPTGLDSPQSVNCQTNAGIENQTYYDVFGFRPRAARYTTLKYIHQIIQNSRGPMFVHCWNGWHASGEIAAIALMQFCGWSGAEAGRYWAENIGDASNLAKYGSIVNVHIGQFQPFSELQISEEKQKVICPIK